MAENMELAEALYFRPRWHWDPVPPFLREHLTIDIVRELTKIQLEKQMRIIEIEQIAIKETLNVIEKMQGR